MTDLDKIDVIRKEINQYYGRKMKSHRRADEKKLFVLFARKYTRLTTTKIAEILHLTYPTVIYHTKTAMNYIRFDKNFERKVDEIDKILKLNLL